MDVYNDQSTAASGNGCTARDGTHVEDGLRGGVKPQVSYDLHLDRDHVTMLGLLYSCSDSIQCTVQSYLPTPRSPSACACAKPHTGSFPLSRSVASAVLDRLLR